MEKQYLYLPPHQPYHFLLHLPIRSSPERKQPENHSNNQRSHNPINHESTDSIDRNRINRKIANSSSQQRYKCVIISKHLIIFKSMGS